MMAPGHHGGAGSGGAHVSGEVARSAIEAPFGDTRYAGALSQESRNRRQTGPGFGVNPDYLLGVEAVASLE